MTSTTRLTLSVAFAATLALAAPPALPSYWTLPAQAKANPDSIVAEDYGEAEFHLPNRDEAVVQRGRHWHADFTFAGVPEDTAAKAIWARIKPSLAQTGWTAAGEQDINPFIATLRYQKNGKDAWAGMSIYGSNDIRVDIIEIASIALKLTLKAPAATPEKISPTTGDFPYLSPLPGSKFNSGEQETVTMLVPTGQSTDELQAVGNGSIKKFYTVPSTVSNALFASVYQDALKQAGWAVIQVSQGLHQSDASVTAHYTANGRDIWASLQLHGDSLLVQVADAGAMDIARDLDRDCRVALYGIHFDFNKATLRPDSAPVLEKVLALLNARADLKLEVQGHTDNIGGADFNKKLSDARASSVVDWLKGKGVNPARLTPKGYGLTVPVADNGTDAGRAKNRRVELKKLGCGK